VVFVAHSEQKQRLLHTPFTKLPSPIFHWAPVAPGALKTRDWKTWNWKTRHQIAGVENTGPENGGTSKLWKAVAVENVQHS